MAHLSIGQAWDDSRPIIARDGRLMFIIALATVTLPQTVLALFAPETTQTMVAGIPVERAEQSGEYMLLTLIASLVNIVGSIAISYLALTRGASVADGLRRGLKRLLPTIGAFLVIFVAAALLAMVVVILVAGASLASVGQPGQIENLTPGAVFAILLVLAFFCWIAVRFMLMSPVIAAEDIGPIQIIKRSWNLTKGHFWRLLGFLILFVVGVIVLMMVVAIVFGLAISLMFGDPEPMTLAALFTGLLMGLAAAMITVVYSTMVARIYLQLAGKPADPDAEELRAA